jgi:hypothetical protein
VGSVSVLVATSDGTAWAGTDYTAVSQTVTFGNGVTQQTVSIPILNEKQVDPRESFTVSLSQPTGGASLGNQTQMVVTITTEVGTPNQRYVAEAYHTLLLREPDLGGLAFWSSALDSGTPRSAVAASLVRSAEYYQTNVIKPAYANLPALSRSRRRRRRPRLLAESVPPGSRQRRHRHRLRRLGRVLCSGDNVVLGEPPLTPAAARTHRRSFTGQRLGSHSPELVAAAGQRPARAPCVV